MASHQRTSECFGSNSIDRRRFLASMAAFAAWPQFTAPQATAGDRRFRFQANPYQLGIASGDPTSSGVVLWTRLAPEPLSPSGGMPAEDVPVRWEIAADEGFSKIVQSGVATAPARLAHSVHVEVEGLEPDRVYWYRFIAGGEASSAGRTRTAPADGVKLDRFRFAFASCQHYEQGFYTAYEHMLKDDLNLVVHLGDYIYEGPASTKQIPRKHIGKEIDSLDDYRVRHALYKTDGALQAMHAAAPWIVTWDDHEFDNNCAGEISEKADVDPMAFLARRANAYQAYYEHMPLRSAQIPTGPHLQLYRQVKFGSLIEFEVLDTRQYRSDQPCGDRLKSPCDEVFSPRATMLGSVQESWLFDHLKKSPAVWNVLAQQVMVAPVDRNPKPDEIAFSMDQWGAYEVPRTRLLKFLEDQKISNPVVLTGDIHSSWVNDLKSNFADPGSATVATEFVGTSISSGGDGQATRKETDKILEQNPFLKYFNGQRGYVRCDLNDKVWKTDYQVVDFVSRPGADCRTHASFVVENGRPGAVRA